MAFGYRQRKNPTPSIIEFYCKIISVVCAVIVAWMQTVDFIPDTWSKIVSGVLSLFILLANALAPFFGKEVKTATVPKSKVTSIDTSVSEPVKNKP